MRRRALTGLLRRVVHGRVQRGVDRAAARVGIEPLLASGNLHDAFTHAYVSARLTVHLGSRIAELMGDINERLGSEADGKLLEAEMDRHNNAVGREIGRRQRREHRTSRRHTAELVKHALDHGDLKVIARVGRGNPAAE